MPRAVRGTESIAADGPYDPLQSTTPLPFQADYFPMGFALRIATNSERVHATAAGIWSGYPRLSGERAVHLNIAVSAAGGALAPPPPSYRGREHLFTVVADRDNFATADLRTGTGFACLTDNVSSDYLRYRNSLEPLAYVLIAARVSDLHPCRLRRAAWMRGSPLRRLRSGKDMPRFRLCAQGLDVSFRRRDRDRAGPERLSGSLEDRSRSDSVRRRGNCFRSWRNTRGRSGPNGKDDIEIDPRDLRLKCALTGTASQIVFLERSHQPIPAIAETFPRLKALRHLEQAICFGDESSRSEQLRSLVALLALPTHRLRYYDLDSAERVLRSLVGERR